MDTCITFAGIILSFPRTITSSSTDIWSAYLRERLALYFHSPNLPIIIDNWIERNYYYAIKQLQKTTNIGTKLSLQDFLENTRWFPVNVRDPLNMVLIVLYFIILFGSLCRNVLTSLYVTLPFDKTVKKFQS